MATIMKEAVDRGGEPYASGLLGFWLWIDRVGGFRVCVKDEITIGQPASDNRVDVPILGDLSRRHATIRRDAESYLLLPSRPVKVAGKMFESPCSLADGNMLELGEGVRLVFRRPHPYSSTARLDLVSRHRFQPAADGVVLLAESCVLGPGSNSHIVCRNMKTDVVLFRQGAELYCRTAGKLQIDGREVGARGCLASGSRVVGEGFSLSLEPADSQQRWPLQ
jgi:hypothetical protein